MSGPGTDRAAAPAALPIVGLIVRREFTSRVRGKAFVLSTLVMLALLVGYAVFVVSIGTGEDSSTVTVAPETAVIAPALSDAARARGDTVRIEPVPSAAAGVDRVRAGDADAALSGPPERPRVDVEDELSDDLRPVITAGSATVARDGALTARGVDPGTVAAAEAAATPTVVAQSPPDPQQGIRLALGAFGAFLLFFSIQTYGGMVAQGVVEEKASRVVELVLATVRPWQLLLGKVVGLGAVGLLQLVVLGGAGLAIASVAGLVPAGAGVAGTLASVVVWYLVGFTLYATIYGALGSLVSRQEDIQSVITPVSLVVLVGWVAGFNLLLSDPRSTVLTVLSMLPPFSPLLMPARTAVGVAPGWQVALAFVLTLAFTAGVLWLGGRIYAASVLRTGARVSLRSALTRP